MRGTTPTLIFRVPFAVENPQAVEITIRAGTDIIKALPDITIVPDNGKTKLYCHLTQEETLSMSDGVAYIQCRIVMQDGEATASDYKMMLVGDLLNDDLLPREDT